MNNLPVTETQSTSQEKSGMVAQQVVLLKRSVTIELNAFTTRAPGPLLKGGLDVRFSL
jgi:hypothetical protein